MLLSVVDRPRPGLVEHSLALAAHATEHGYACKTIHACAADASPCEEYPWSLPRLIQQAWRSPVIVVWSFGVVALLLPLLRLICPFAVWCVVLHEPGGLRAKMKKGDIWYRALISAFLEWNCILFANWIIVPRKDKAALVPFAKVVSLPLLYRSASHKGVEVAIRDTCPPKILYVGRRDDRRKLNLFQSETFRDSIRKKAHGCTFDFFPPRANSFATTDEKLAAFKHASAVLNFYTVPYNQSGVTVDALINGVPVLVSDFDPHAEIMRQYGLALPADSGDDKIASALLQMIRDQDHLRVIAKRLGDKLGGIDAFRATWLKWLASVQDGHLPEVKDIKK